VQWTAVVGLCAMADPGERGEEAQGEAEAWRQQKGGGGGVGGAAASEGREATGVSLAVFG